ncbi:lipopolysaccharide heptosyltransferase II [Vibrio sp. 404]|uniref:lipopolysaccharide heptosyltransferase II n=1 Tax=Vibrio marinisediminis TaxID=2758441 RepID=A0A7W2FRG4_9VIBR|nr:lipopolysaccharide heptosyltransferase II [Vibrio marinisediminis]MBA5762814.1 lipopolysaccharide heptosyltransferase II [Vibrio marinisediminis]
MKILIIGPSWVGDMVMSQSLYITLMQKYPHAEIDVLAPDWCKPILERMPEVKKAIPMPLGHGDIKLFARWRLGKELKNQNYDRAYILPNSAKSALIPWFAGIPQRIGWKGEMRFGLLNDLRANKRSFQYMVERYVALAYPKTEMLNSNSLGGLSTLPKPKLAVDKFALAHTLEKLGLNQNKPIIGLCPGAEFGPAKKWPNEYYADIASALNKQGFQVWLFGSKNDIDSCQSIEGLVHCKEKDISILAGKTTLVEAVDLLASCQTVVSNDSGLMHIASSVGCNVVAIYGSTSPKYTPPLAKHVEYVATNIECRPCFKRTCQFGHLKCLTELNPKIVLSAIDRLHKLNNNLLKQ